MMGTALLLLTCASIGQYGDELGDRAEIELVVVRDGTPIENANLFVDDTNYGVTDNQGALIAQIPSGRTALRVTKGEEVLLELDLLTDSGELVLIIATINEGEEPDLLIESSGKDSVLASEADPEAEPREFTPQQKDERPPGALTGTVTSAEEGEPIPRAQLFFSGITIEVETDKNGEFQVELPAGTYSVSIVHPRFSSQTLENIRVISERQVTLNIELTPAGIRLQDYVVTAPYVEGSIASVVEQQRAASGVSDVLGAAQIEATGDSNAAEALTRVTGLTVEDGKFVLIRGQPSRFTLALFNGSPLPSPEPLLRVVPLDLFPTGVLQGIEVQKSYSPDVQGAFGAGLIQLNTRGVPAAAFFKLSVSGGYNTQTTGAQGLSYQGGSYDWLSFDDGTRALPARVEEATEGGTLALNRLDQDTVEEVASMFPNILQRRDKTLPPNFGVGMSGGGSIGIPWDGSVGVIGTVSWSNNWQRQDRIQRDFAAVAGPALETRSDFRELRTDNDVTLSALLTAAAEWDAHQLRLNTFVVNQSQERTQFTTGRRITSDILDIRGTLLSWIERSLIAEQLLGQHDFGPVQLEYRGLLSRARRDAPDRREYEYSATPQNQTFIVREPSGLIRRYSFVDDTQVSFGIDLSSDYFAKEDDWFRIKPKVGVALNRVDRDAGTQQFLWLPEGFENLDEPNPEIFFDPTNTGESLTLIDLSTRGADDYTGKAEIFGYYGMLDIEFGEYVRIVTGARQETAEFQVDTFQASVEDSEIISTGFDQSELLPSASVTWFALDDLQIRGAYGRTTSRPVFNELTPSFFFDPDSGQEFIGNPDLGPTMIDGYDLRAEWYPSTTESLTAGVFLKDYQAPIERTFLAQGGGGQVATFQNAESADVRGVEVGGRVEFGRLRDWFGAPKFVDLFSFSANAAFLDSQVTLVEQGRATDSERTLDGQADLVFNAQFTMNAEDHDLTIAYNHVGVRLARVGIRNQPNILQRPMDLLDLNYVWHITDALDLKMSGANLLNTKISLTQQIEGEERQVFREFRSGRTFSIGLSYEFK